MREREKEFATSVYCSLADLRYVVLHRWDSMPIPCHPVIAQISATFQYHKNTLYERLAVALQDLVAVAARLVLVVLQGETAAAAVVVAATRNLDLGAIKRRVLSWKRMTLMHYSAKRQILLQRVKQLPRLSTKVCQYQLVRERERERERGTRVNRTGCCLA
jgi:hypothetical protein